MLRRCFSFCIDVLTLNKNSSKDGKMLTIKPDSEKITFYFFKCIDLVKFHVNLKLLPKLFSKYITDAFKVMPNTKHYFIRKVALFSHDFYLLNQNKFRKTPTT